MSDNLNIRIKFQKYGAMKFIGHLDLMRFFQKAIRRAGIDIAYSEGFSPHQIMSFAAPLGVGLTSDGEYLDISVTSAGFGENEMGRLEQAMAEGISILGYQKVPDMGKPSMSLVAAADYLVYVNDGGSSIFQSYQVLQDKVQAFYEGQEEIVITKKTKKSTAEMDLKHFIYKMEAISWKEMGIAERFSIKNPEILSLLSQEKASCPKDTGYSESQELREPGGMLFLRLSTGSSNNLKPELVLEAFCNFCGVGYDPFLFQVHRLEVYAKADEIPVKGEQGRAKYQEYLEKLKESYAREGKTFPEWFALGEIPYGGGSGKDEL